ncbi:MAG TPA: L,D-transpeptidase family protein [bacterium]|nr:L,D-transpeptidase family protein [bacterium]HQM83935.1 L,D-transpeptidase family protein [bacterium]
MKNYFLLLLLFFTFAVFADSAFLADQKKFGRVRSAYEQKWEFILSTLKNEKIDPDKLNILIVSFKDEGQLDVYGKNKSETQYKKLKSYKICSKSGDLGPKRKQGDYQVPEGFYHIDRFNPSSSYYLSLGLNYPNESDKKKSSFQNLGGDIFIHGECVTIGCMPMTNDKIKEIYILAIEAKNNGQNRIPVYVFPFEMNDGKFNKFKNEYKNDPGVLKFWTNIKGGYDLFIRNRTELNFSVDKKGDYLF